MEFQIQILEVLIARALFCNDSQKQIGMIALLTVSNLNLIMSSYNTVLVFDKYKLKLDVDMFLKMFYESQHFCIDSLAQESDIKSIT